MISMILYLTVQSNYFAATSCSVDSEKQISKSQFREKCLEDGLEFGLELPTGWEYSGFSVDFQRFRTANRDVYKRYYLCKLKSTALDKEVLCIFVFRTRYDSSDRGPWSCYETGGFGVTYKSFGRAKWVVNEERETCSVAILGFEMDSRKVFLSKTFESALTKQFGKILLPE